MPLSKRTRFVLQGDTPFFDRWPDWASNRWPAHRLQQAGCMVGGHDPIPDQCGIPDHDFCAWCGRSMPGEAPRRRAN